MSHFALVENGIVTKNIVAEQNFIDTGVMGDPASWVQNSYNTRNGVHLLGGTPLRGNFAGIGYIYDKDNDIFYPPQPYPSWTLDVPTASWTAPVAYPTDGNTYAWDETTTSWKSL